MVRYFFRINLLLSFFIYSSILMAQTKQLDNQTYDWFDQIIGNSNSGFFKGVLYVEKYNVINDQHNFFKSSNFMKGSVDYFGTKFSNLELKYNVFEDQLLARHMGINYAQVIVILEKNEITDFSIDKHFFKNINFLKTKKNKEVWGFVEVLIENDVLIFYKKHRKKIIKKTNDKMLTHTFKNSSSYYVFYNNEWVELKNKKNVDAVFYQYEVELNKIYSKYKSSRKTTFNNYIESVILDLNKIINKKLVQ